MPVAFRTEFADIVEAGIPDLVGCQKEEISLRGGRTCVLAPLCGLPRGILGGDARTEESQIGEEQPESTNACLS